MLTKIAWKNVWRSKGRSITIIMAIAIGIASISFLMGFINGFIDSFVKSSLNNEISHIQIHNPDFKTDKEIQYSIGRADKIVASLRSSDSVYAVSPRLVFNSMITSTTGASGITVLGINPEDEAKLTGIDSAIVEGEYFTNISRNPILISVKTAEKMKLKLRSKLVLTFQDLDGNITASSFRVSGIFDSPSAKVNESMAFVKAGDLQRVVKGVGVHEIAILLESMDMVAPFAATLQRENEHALVETWNVLSPQLELMQSQVWINMIVILVIIMGALCFGIVNTMLMAVLERVRELGMLMAVGMKKTRVFKMIILETLMMAAVGGPLGILLGLLINNYFATYGLDLSVYSEGLKEFGYASVLYPQVLFTDYLIISVAIAVTALIASIYPARKAIKLRPVEALHKI